MNIEEKVTKLLQPMETEMRNKHEAANSRCPASAGSLPSIVLAKKSMYGYEVEDIDTEEVLSTGPTMREACEKLWAKLGARPTQYRTSICGNFFCFSGHEDRLHS